MTRKPLLSLFSLSLVLLLMLSGLPLKIHAQDTTEANEYPVSIELTGVIQSIKGNQLTLTDGTVVKIGHDTTGADGLKAGDSIVITADLDDEDLIAVSISINDGSAVEEPPLESTVEANDKGSSVGKGNSNDDDDEDEDEDEDEDSGNKGKGKGKGNKDKDDKGNKDKGNNGKGNGKGNGKDKGNKDKDNEKNEAECLARTNVHPVASRLAASLGVAYSEIWGWHCAGNGFGEIARAYLISREPGVNVTVAQIFAMRDEGMGWGKILKALGLNPGKFAPGKLKNHGKKNK